MADTQINIIKASLAELKNIKGTGEVKATAMIKLRAEKRRLSLDELSSIPVISRTT